MVVPGAGRPVGLSASDVVLSEEGPLDLLAVGDHRPVASGRGRLIQPGGDVRDRPGVVRDDGTVGLGAVVFVHGGKPLRARRGTRCRGRCGPAAAAGCPPARRTPSPAARSAAAGPGIVGELFQRLAMLGVGTLVLGDGDFLHACRGGATRPGARACAGPQADRRLHRHGRPGPIGRSAGKPRGSDAGAALRPAPAATLSGPAAASTSAAPSSRSTTAANGATAPARAVLGFSPPDPDDLDDPATTGRRTASPRPPRRPGRRHAGCGSRSTSSRWIARSCSAFGRRSSSGRPADQVWYDPVQGRSKCAKSWLRGQSFAVSVGHHGVWRTAI